MLSSESQQNIIWTKKILFLKGGNFFRFSLESKSTDSFSKFEFIFFSSENIKRKIFLFDNFSSCLSFNL